MSTRASQVQRLIKVTNFDQYNILS